MRPWLLIALLVGGVALAKPKRVPPPPRRPGAPEGTAATANQGPGQVTFLTTTTAYLDRGLVDRLAVGSGLTVTRAGRLVGRCTIATISDRWSTCSAQQLKVGDRLAVERELPLPPPAPAPVPDGAELQVRKQRVEAEDVPLVDFAGGGGGLLGRGTRFVSLAASHTTWVNLASANGPFHVQRIDVGVYDVPIWRGLHGSADLTVLNFSQRPENARSPNGTPVLLVRQLELSFHTPSLPLIAQVGRTWTRYTPGLLMLDGAQAGWRNKDDTFEVGGYGGLLPDPVSLSVSTQRRDPSTLQWVSTLQWTVGAFVMARFEADRGAKSSLFQVEAHLGYAERAMVPGRLELGAAAHAWLTRSFDAHLQLELGALSAVAPGLVDAVRLDFGWRPTETIRLYAGGRYQGAVAADILEPGVTLTGGQRAIHADAGLTVELSPRLWLGASTGAASDFASGLTQVHLGPELTLAGLLRGTTCLTLGYQEELGWLRGRTAWLQLTFVPVTRLRILARGSWFNQQLEAGAEGIAGHELGAALMVDLAITRWLWVRATALGRGQPGGADFSPGSALGGTVMGQLGGQL